MTSIDSDEHELAPQDDDFKLPDNRSSNWGTPEDDDIRAGGLRCIESSSNRSCGELVASKGVMSHDERRYDLRTTDGTCENDVTYLLRVGGLEYDCLSIYTCGYHRDEGLEALKQYMESDDCIFHYRTLAGMIARFEWGWGQ